MNKEILSSRQYDKILESWKEYIEEIRTWKYNGYILYINKDFYDKYKDKIDLIDGEIEIITNLPKDVNAVYMKKTDWRITAWYE